MTPESMARLHAAAFKQDRPWSAPEFKALLAGAGAHLTAYPQGFALWRAVAGEAELLTIAVDPAHQRQGIGTRLMRNWMQAAEHHAETAFLEVAADNTVAIDLYARHGFQQAGRRPGYYTHRYPPVDALILRAALPRGSASP